MINTELKILSCELDAYEAEQRAGHYVKAFDMSEYNDSLTLLVRDDVWEQHNRRDVVKYQTSSVSISRDDAVELAKWILERFGE